MPPSKSQIRLISLLFLLGRSDRPATLAGLCRLTGLSAATVSADLDALDRAGLVRADRVRLTLPGLALAASLGACQRRGYAAAA